MSSKSKSNNVNSLLATIQRKAPSNPAQDEPPPEAPVEGQAEKLRKPAQRAAAPVVGRSRVGKPVQFWLHDEDRRLVRELAAWLAGQGERPTDSMVIRAALRMAKTDPDLLKAYRQASQLDGRLKQHKTA
jgi:hypothetical protein